MKKSIKIILNKVKTNKVWIMAYTVIICAFLVMLYPALPVSSERMEKSMAMVECRSHYELLIDGKTTVYMDDDDIQNARLSFSKDSVPYVSRHLYGQWIYRHAFLPICNGTIVVTDSESDKIRKAETCNNDMKTYISQCIVNLDDSNKKTSRKLDELDYYLRTHNVTDDGYNSIADYANDIRVAKERADSAMDILRSIRPNQKTEIRLVTDYILLYNNVRIQCKSISRGNNLCIIQTHDKTTPSGAKPLFLRNPLMTQRKPKGSIDSYFDSNGHLNGHTITTDSSSVYSGYFENGRKSGYGIMTFPKDSSRFVGKWNADTIKNGTRIAKNQYYNGHLNRKMQASGFGTSRHTGGTYYEGEWLDGKRNGFGWAVDSAGDVKSGEWKQGKFYGERLLYTSERIYGIDISRHQHEKGRKRYSINWKNIRITHLGKISNKRVDGDVNYPISFVYIKSTEGITIRNKYYASDYAQARKNGIKCGAYHFFSLKSDAKRQANYFLKNSKFNSGDFPPVLDVEPSDLQIRKAGGAEVMFRMIRTWLRTVESRTGVRPILYVGQKFVNKYLPLAPDIMDNYKVWIARYGEYKPDVKLVFWQLCPDGRVNGIHGDVDINVFNGYEDVFNHFLDNDRIK